MKMGRTLRMEAQKADFGVFKFRRQIKESRKYFDFKTRCRKLYG
jgi:very-short-patch-repair endonuclease